MFPTQFVLELVADPVQEDDEDASEASEEARGSVAASDDDFAEEDNDYCANYFDNGEGYGDLGSDDNIDGEEF